MKRRMRGNHMGPSGPALSVLLSLSLICAAGAGVPAAGEEVQPEGAAILDRYVDVTGGLKAYEKVHNRVTKGTFEIVQAGISAGITIYHAKPNKFYSRVESDALGKIESGVSGDVAWEMSMMTGPKVKEGQERDDTLHDAVFDKFAYWRTVYRKVEHAGIDSVGGKPCDKVVVTAETGNPQTLYFERESGLLVKADAVIEHQMGSISIEVLMDDYREIDGILMPFKATVLVMGQERVITTESVEHNVEIPENRFELPDEIQALLEKSKGE